MTDDLRTGAAKSAYFSEDAALSGTLLALNMAMLWLSAAIAMKVKMLAANWEFLEIVSPFLLLPGVLALGMRMIWPTRRFSWLTRAPAISNFAAGKPVACNACGKSESIRAVHYIRLTGLVLVSSVREANLYACDRCSSKLCARHRFTRYCLVGGRRALFSLSRPYYSIIWSSIFALQPLAACQTNEVA